MRIDTLQRMRKLRPDMVPPRGAVPIGLHDDGRMIYEMDRRDHAASKNNKVQVMGPDGEPLFRKAADGQAYPVMRLKPVTYKAQFVLERSHSGAVFINENFRASEDEKQRDQANKIRNDFGELLAQTAVERGLSAEELIERLLDAPIKEVKPGQVLVEENYPIHRGGTAWILSNGDTFHGVRKGAQEAETAVSGKTFTTGDAEITVEAIDEPEVTEDQLADAH